MAATEFVVASAEGRVVELVITGGAEGTVEEALLDALVLRRVAAGDCGSSSAVGVFSVSDCEIGVGKPSMTFVNGVTLARAGARRADARGMIFCPGFSVKIVSPIMSSRWTSTYGRRLRTVASCFLVRSPSAIAVKESASTSITANTNNRPSNGTSCTSKG